VVGAFGSVPQGIYIFRGIDMRIMCKIFGHKWNGCLCTRCGEIRDEHHDWDLNWDIRIGKCRQCRLCGKIMPVEKLTPSDNILDYHKLVRMLEMEIRNYSPKSKQHRAELNERIEEIRKKLKSAVALMEPTTITNLALKQGIILHGGYGKEKCEEFGWHDFVAHNNHDKTVEEFSMRYIICGSCRVCKGEISKAHSLRVVNDGSCITNICEICGLKIIKHNFVDMPKSHPRYDTRFYTNKVCEKCGEIIQLTYESYNPM
jgi:hypothetical protein